MSHDIIEDFTVLRSTAAMLHRIGQYEKSIKGYTKALELKHNDRHCLVKRSQCNLALGDTTKALADAESALTEDKTFYQGILWKAEAMFQRGDFEMALVFYHRGKRLRPDIQEFSLGIQKASEAIENSVGTPDHVKLTTTGDLSFFYEQSQPAKHLKAFKGLQRKMLMSATGPKPAKRDPNKSKAHKRTVHQLLGQMFHDKEYLERLLEATEETNESGKKICALADDCLKYLDKRTDFWRHQKPMYSRLYDKKVFQRRFGRKDNTQIDETILTQLENIDEAQSSGKYRRALSRATQCLQSLSEFSASQVSNRQVLKGQVNSCIGNACLELRQYQKALKHHQEDFRISRKFGILEGVSRSMDNIGRVHFRQGDFEKAISVWESKLPLVRSNTEGLWLTQELCRSYLALERPMDALYYAANSLDEIGGDDNPAWALHGNVLAGQCKVRLNDFEAASIYYHRALAVAHSLEDSTVVGSLREIVQDIQKKLKKDSKMRDKHSSTATSPTDSQFSLKEIKFVKDMDPVIQDKTGKAQNLTPSKTMAEEATTTPTITTTPATATVPALDTTATKAESPPPAATDKEEDAKEDTGKDKITPTTSAEPPQRAAQEEGVGEEGQGSPETAPEGSEKALERSPEGSEKAPEESEKAPESTSEQNP